MNILEILAQSARERCESEKLIFSLEEAKRTAQELPKGDFCFERALLKQKISFICECKKASPSKGIISESFPYLNIAKQYEKGGADCISVLTEPTRFLGSDKYLEEISSAVDLPCLRKDFTVDEYMIYKAKILGASAVLLICSILDNSILKEYIEICDSIGLSALVETHDEKEIEMAVDSGARIIGVNNRNLTDFSVDTDNSRKLRSLVPKNIIFVAESGIKNRDDVILLEKSGCNAVLVGETLMRAENVVQKLKTLKGEL